LRRVVFAQQDQPSGSTFPVSRVVVVENPTKVSRMFVEAVAGAAFRFPNCCHVFNLLIFFFFELQYVERSFAISKIIDGPAQIRITLLTSV
jgi:hypothetical protein